MILAFICFIAFFLRLGANGLFDLDEALYANAAREMALRGDYISPRVNGVFFFEKPPFIYWGAAVFYHILGFNEFSARLPSAVAASATAFLIFSFGRARFGNLAGFFAGAFFALSPIVLGAARQLTTDATLTLCVSAALLCFFRAHELQNSNCKHWYYGFWAASAFGVLTKGAPGVIIPAAIVVVYLGILERFNPRTIAPRLMEMKLFSGLTLFLFISVPWHIAAWKVNGEAFFQEYILRQHLQRFRGGDEAHRLPFWFYIPGFVLGFFPWSVFAIPALFERNPRPAAATPDPRLFLKVWFWVVFVVFSVSGSKLISYVLPLYPASAFLAGDWCARAACEPGKRRALFAGGICALAVTGLVFMGVTFHGPLIRLIEAVSHQPARVDSVPAEFLVLAQHLFGVGAVALVVFVVMTYRKANLHLAFSVLIAGMALFVLFAVLEGLPAIDRQFSAPLREAAKSASSMARTGETMGIFIGQPRRPSIFFYLPPSLIAPNGGDSLAVEATDPAKVDEYLRRPGRFMIVSDKERAAIVRRDSQCRITSENDPWTVFEKSP